eukprot:496040_1
MSQRVLLFLSWLLPCLIAVNYPNAVCVIGDVQAQYDSSRDPRTLMGTYHAINRSIAFDEQIVDTSAPIYEHFYFGNNTGDVGQQQYLFKIKKPVGWALSETLPEPEVTITVFLTCFSSSLFDCGYDRWWWGYNKFDYRMDEMEVKGGECKGAMCLRNLTIQMKSNEVIAADPPNGPDESFSKLDGEYHRTWDNQTDRYEWYSSQTSNLRWYYRENIGAGGAKSFNWVLASNGADRIACAPGYVEMPLFCTTFVYAGGEYADPEETTYISFNPDLPGDRLGIPSWAAEEGDVITTFRAGVCGDTDAPTAEPTMEPSSFPTIEPTLRPTGPPRCEKEYIFEATDPDTTVTKDCPFGWIGSGITRYCHPGGDWETESDDCFLISFTDDFTYFRDELWRATTGFEGSLDPDKFDSDSQISSLVSYPSFKGPFKIAFSAISNESYCGGYDFQFVDEVLNTTDGDLRVYWDCDASVIDMDDATDSSVVAHPSDSIVNGYILYREDNNGDTTVIFKGLEGASIAQVTEINGSFNDPQPLMLALYHRNETLKRIQWTELKLTSFVDWFNSQREIWTTFPSTYFITNYATAFTTLDPVGSSTFIEFESPQSLESDETQFQFVAPFVLSLVYGTQSFDPNYMANQPNSTTAINNRTSEFKITLETATTKSNIFKKDTGTYESTYLTIELTEEALFIETLNANVSETPYPLINNTNTSACSDGERLVQVSVTPSNVSVIIYNSDGSPCVQMELEDTSDIDASSLDFSWLRIEPSEGSFVSLGYLDVSAGALPNIETTAPSSAPTMAPTISCAYEDALLEVNETVSRKCEFGFSGAGDTSMCQESGELSDWTQGCFIISFSDEFSEFDDDKWYVYSPEGVSGQAAMALDGSPSLRLIPQDDGLAAVLRSRQRIVWPMRAQTMVSKRDGECNAWAMGLGKHWHMRQPFSTRVNWGCLKGPPHRQMSLYNHTFRLYDGKCWNDPDDETLTMTFSVRDAGHRPGSEMTAGSDCATLDLQVTDILSQTPWEDAYLWLGSWGEVEDPELKGYLNASHNLVGRFESVQYTRFYSEFNTYMEHIWDTNLTTATEKSGTMLMQPGDVAVADADLFQFTIPFKIKIEINAPSRTLEDEEKGHYAHFVSLGGTQYVEEPTEDVVQIVWDGTAETRLIYTSQAIHVTGLHNEQTEDDEFYCNWDSVDTKEIVMIYVDETKITVIDELCNEYNMTATHHLNTTEISTLSLGFIRPDAYEEVDRIAFTLIEAYQYPLAYAGEIADPNADSDTIDDILVVYPLPKDKENLLFGLEIVVFILICVGVAVLCIVCYCAVAFKLRCCPFSRSGAQKKEVSNGQSGAPPPVKKDNTQNLERMDSHSEQTASNAGNDALQQKLIQRKDPNGNGYNQQNMMMQQQQQQQQQQMMMQQQQQQQMMMQQQMGMQQGMGMQQQMGMPMDQNLQYQMYQQQLFYQQQFMQMMMTNPQQQAILQSMNPMQRKHYIHSQMMIYMSRITAMQQQNMIPMGVQQMQQQYMQSNPGGSGEGGEGGAGQSNNTGFMEGGAGGGGLSTNAIVNMSYDNFGGGGVEMQQLPAKNVDILNEFFNVVPVEQFYQMCPVGRDGVARTDANRARLMIAKFRGIPPTDVDVQDEAVAYFENLSLMELKNQLSSLPDPIYELLKGDNYHPVADYTNGIADFLVEFCEKVNLKQIFDDLGTAVQMQEPRLDAQHARSAVANLRSQAVFQVSESDPGVQLIIDKNLVEMRFYLSNLPMPQLKLLDLKTYHRYMKGEGNVRIPAAKGAVAAGGIVFPTINVNYNGDIRQFKPPKFGCFDEIIGFIKSAWPHLNVNQYKLMYQDTQAQWNRITTSIDVQECIKEAVQQKSTHLNINVVT